MKKVLKRTLLLLLVLLLLAQIPFICRRYQTGKLAEKIAQLESQRTARTDPHFKEYKGIIHAHTSLGGHSTGSFEELITAANANGLDFVLMTEHYSDTFDTAAQTLNGVYGKTLFIGGNEIDTIDGDRFLLIPGGGEAAKARTTSTSAFRIAAQNEGKLALVTYPERFKSWDVGADGIEVFSLHTAAKQMNVLTALGDFIWTYPAYPELMLAKGWTRPAANLAKFDEIAAGRPTLLFAGTDAHSNIGFHLFGDDAGNKLINIKLDPYETIFRMVRIHIVIPVNQTLDRSFPRAIGSSFIGFDAIGDSTGFRFVAEHNRREWPSYSMGSWQVDSSWEGLKLVSHSPLPARFILFKNGEPVSEIGQTTELIFPPTGPGLYRVEVYRDELGSPFDKMPWIISNPIYVR